MRENSYTGGTRIGEYGREERTKVGRNTAFGTGPVTLEANAVTDVMFTLETSVSMANAFKGIGRIATGANVFTLTGSVAPGASVGQFGVEDLDFRGTYEFEYDTSGGDVDPDDSDLVVTDTLVFGNPDGAAGVNVTWLGLGGPGSGDYVLFTYTGADPVITAPWTVTGDMNGNVWVDGLKAQVILTLGGGAPTPEPGALGLFLLGLPVLLRRRRRR